MADEMGQPGSDVYQRLERFSAVQGHFDRWLFEYGPVLVIGQGNAAGLAIILVGLYNILHPDPKVITWAMGLAYAAVLAILFIESLAMRSFLSKIPDAFRRLWEGGALGDPSSGGPAAAAFVSFADDFERKLNSHQRLWLGVPLAILGLYFFWSTRHLVVTIVRWFDGSDLATKLVTTAVNGIALFVPAVIVGYAIGVGMWKSIVTGLYVRRFSQEFDLVVQPSHPDKAGGLRPLGDLVLSMATILIIASLVLTGLTIYAGYINFARTEAFSRIFLGVAFALSLIAFFLPLLSTHNRMVAERDKLRPLLADIARRIAELERSTQDKVRDMDHETRKEIFEEIDSLTELYRRNTRLPTWPFDRDIFIRFATPQLFSLLSLTGVAEPIADVVRWLFQR